MLFNSFVFVYGFLPLALLGYHASARYGRTLAVLWLILASLVFYGWWNATFVPLLLASIAFNYAASSLIVRSAARPALQGWILRTAVAANLAALIYYKYAMWLAGLLAAVALPQVHLPEIVLPLGISFFTFTQIGYLLDCRSGAVRDRNPLNYAVFVTFFPHLIAGPILHNGEMMPQFANPATYRFSATSLTVGMGMFVLGMLKKCLLADPIGAFVSIAYADPGNLPLFAAWRAVLSYSLQLYFDFSGYSDMAGGLALMFSLRFPLNFNSPYKSLSVVDYWQRWHMTLTRYFTQYLYNPLAIAAMRRRTARHLPINRAAQTTLRGFSSMAALPIIVTILLAGIWHGAGAQFLVFGLLHATYLTVNRAVRIWRPNRPEPHGWGVLWRVALTYGCVLLGSVFFRAPSVAAALSMLGSVLGLHGIAWPDSWASARHTAGVATWLATLYGIVWALPNTQEIFADWHPALDAVTPPRLGWLRWHPSPRWAIAMGCATGLAALAIGGTGEFLYFQF